MKPLRWWSVILALGLFMGLSPLNAQAGPNRTFAPQVNRRAFSRPQPHAFNHGRNNQPYQCQQVRGNAYGWNGYQRQAQQHPGRAFGWHGQDRQWRQPQRNAYGWQGQARNWQQPRGQAVGWNGTRSQRQPNNVAGWNGQQHRGSSDQGYQQFPSPNQNQASSRPSYTPIGYSGTRQVPTVSSGSYTYPSNASAQRDRSHPQAGFQGPQSSGSISPVPAGPTQVSP